MKRTGVVRRRWRDGIKNGEVILCAICKKPLPFKATGNNKISKGGKGGLTVDHIIPRSKGGTDALSNLQPTHLLRNNLKGDTNA